MSMLLSLSWRAYPNAPILMLFQQRTLFAIGDGL